MAELLGDRFVSAGNGWIDLASGAPVRLRLARAGDRHEQMLWNDWCSELSRIRHPALNPLIDFGLVGTGCTFEAYAVSQPVSAPAAAGSLLLTHAARFLDARRVALTSSVAPWIVRDIPEGVTGRRRFLGIVLQPRAAHAALTEMLNDAGGGGPLPIEISGGQGSGLKTLRCLTARAARVAGYVPISSAALVRVPWLHAVLWDRHVCVFLEQHTSTEAAVIAAFLSRLATHSARRHIVLRFARTEKRSRTALEIEPMGVSRLMEMVFVDRDCGPAESEMLRAAREAGGWPGAFLARLRAASFGDHAIRMAAVHESPAVYESGAEAAIQRVGRRRLRRVLVDATSRAAQLASRGRHAAARRLLVRAGRILEGRRELEGAAECAEALGWLDRNRGHGERAVEAFVRARTLAGDSVCGVASAIGLGVLWTDQQRFVEAEAALRGAAAAAEILAAPALAVRAAISLARCLYWQARHDEATVVLTPYLTSAGLSWTNVEAWALFARINLASSDLRTAVDAAARATERAAESTDPRLTTIAARAMAMVQRSLGDRVQARLWIERGSRASAMAHLPLARLRFKVLSEAMGPDDRDGHRAQRVRLMRALRRCALPKLLRSEIDAVLAGRDSRDASATPLERPLNELQHLLEVVQAGEDDQSALGELCRVLVERLRAATVQVVTGSSEPRTLARAGRPWQGDVQTIERILTGGAALTADAACEPYVAAHPIRYGQEPIGVLCCRWTAGVAAEPRRANELLHAGALAAAAPVRSVLDRAQLVSAPAARGDLIGSSPPAVQLRDAIARAARAPFPVLLEGESGSGKELVARGIHRSSARRDRRLCTVNCAALSDDLLEAELFGHARGAFTGAIGERAGLFEEADGGTLFLDEVGELSPRAQAKLLRVLQDGEVRRVGENLPRRVDARIIAATNRQLADEVAANRFRADLRFRLDVVRIVVPPLRERATDIPALAAHFWAEATARIGSSATLTPDTLAALARYDWPGNVRELQNAVASLAVHAPRRGRVVPSMLPAHIARSGAAGAATFEMARQEFERRYVRAALAQSGGHRARAARELGLSRQGLAKMMRRLQID